MLASHGADVYEIALAKFLPNDFIVQGALPSTNKLISTPNLSASGRTCPAMCNGKRNSLASFCTM